MMEQVGHGQPAAQAEACLRIYLLGPTWVEWQGEPLDIRRRQARGLLYRLAAQLQPVPREELCLTFWPGVPEAIARRHLSHLLNHLREALPVPQALAGTREILRLDPRRAWSDAVAFRAACALPDGRQIAALQQGLELYRGPFLWGFSLGDGPEFERWVAQQRTAYERLYLDALAVLSPVRGSQADLHKAILSGNPLGRT